MTNTLNNYEQLNPDVENLSQEEKEAKVYQLEVELAEAVLEKKSFVRAANDNLKRIKAEIKDLVKNDVKLEQIS